MIRPRLEPLSRHRLDGRPPRLALQFVEFVKRVVKREKKTALTDEEDDFVVTPGHIPFGPFMVVGYLLAIFVGDRLVEAYLRWAGLR